MITHSIAATLPNSKRCGCQNVYDRVHTLLLTALMWPLRNCQLVRQHQTFWNVVGDDDNCTKPSSKIWPTGFRCQPMPSSLLTELSTNMSLIDSKISVASPSLPLESILLQGLVREIPAMTALHKTCCMTKLDSWMVIFNQTCVRMGEPNIVKL